jgi:ribosome-associated protein
MASWKPKLIQEVSFSAVRSQGPGGQNVNKVSSAAQLTWKPEHSLLFTEEEKRKILSFLRVDKSGAHRIHCQKFRDLPANKKACLEKLMERIEVALAPKKVRYKTKPTKASVKRREESKRRRSEIKKLRDPVRDH